MARLSRYRVPAWRALRWISRYTGTSKYPEPDPEPRYLASGTHRVAIPTLTMSRVKSGSYEKEMRVPGFLRTSGLFLVGKKSPVHHYYSPANPFMRDIVSVAIPGRDRPRRTHANQTVSLLVIIYNN
jgi:hypothetical protein